MINMAFPGGRLTVGSVKQIFSIPDFNAPVVLQVLEIKKMAPSKPTGNAPERFRCVVSRLRGTPKIVWIF